MLGLTRAGGPAVPALVGAGLAFTLAAAGCTDPDKSTELRPEGPPTIMQVFVQEKVQITTDTGTITRTQTQLAYGTHPDIPEEEDDRSVTNAIADSKQKMRVVVDELLQGNYLEEVVCADGSWDTVPVGATPDDIADCAGPEVETTCTGDFTVCVTEDGPVGILDENEDGAVDDTRLIDGVIRVVCGGTEIPIDRQLSYYQPSGNQQIPAGAGIAGLGPALVIQPTTGLRTGSECTIEFADTVVDKQDIAICAPSGSPIDNPDCTPGDTSQVAFTVEPLKVESSNPQDEQTNVPLSPPNSPDANLVVQLNAAVDPASADGSIVILEGGTELTGLPAPTVSEDDPTFIFQEIPGGYAPNTTYEVTVLSGDGGVKDQFGGIMPEDYIFSFETTDAQPMPDAAPMPDAGTDAGAVDGGADAGA